jgi:drug/metabolite transporter (DMT)-like permease
VSSVSEKGMALQLFGNICFVIATLGAVLHTIYNKKALKQVNPYVVTCLGFFMSSVAFFTFMVYELQSWSFSQLDFHGWIGILYGIFFSSGIAYFLHSYAASKMVAQEIGIFSYMAPIVSIIVAIPLVHEYPDVYFVIGAVLIMVGIYVGEMKKNKMKMTQKDV